MRKRFKAKKRINFKIIYVPIIVVILLLLFNYIERNIKLSISNEVIIDNIFKDNNYSYNDIESVSIYDEVYEYIKENIFNTPVNLLKNQLNYNTEKKEVISFMYGEAKKNRVYIYNSHQGETYSMKYLEAYNIVPDVLMASNMLKDKLDSIGINTIVENSDILAYMKENNLNHAGSYIASKYFLTKAMNKYKDVELFIDLHRDAATHQATYTTINGNDCAKVLFVIGLENPNYEVNLNLVTKLNNMILDKYPSLTRGIMKKEGAGVNGVYNQDLSGNVILIEVGGNENNIEEVNNTLDLIAEIIGEYLNEKEEK